MKHLKSATSLCLFSALLLAMVYLTGVLTETMNAEVRHQWNSPTRPEQQKIVSGVHVIGEPIDIRLLPEEVLHDHKKRSRQIFIDDKNDSVYEDTDGVWHKVQFNGLPITHINFSPIEEKRLGFLYYPANETYYDTVLMLMDNTTRETKELSRRDFRSSVWEWDGLDKVIVYYNCGSSCLYAYKIDIHTGKTVDDYHILIPTVTTRALQSD